MLYPIVPRPRTSSLFRLTICHPTPCGSPSPQCLFHGPPRKGWFVRNSRLQPTGPVKDQGRPDLLVPLPHGLTPPPSPAGRPARPQVAGWTPSCSDLIAGPLLKRPGCTQASPSVRSIDLVNGHYQRPPRLRGYIQSNLGSIPGRSKPHGQVVVR